MVQPIEWALDAFDDLAASDKPEAGVGAGPPAPRTKGRKRSTQRGDGRTKIISALTHHHQFAKDGCLNLEPIGNNELAELATVARSTVSDYFKKEVGGYKRYRIACRDSRQLAIMLKLLRKELSPIDLYGAHPPEKGDEDEDDDEE
jgi:hypothetical protein